MLLVFADPALRILAARVRAAQSRVSTAAAWRKTAEPRDQAEACATERIESAMLAEAVGALRALRRCFGLPDDYFPGDMTTAELLDFERGE